MVIFGAQNKHEHRRDSMISGFHRQPTTVGPRLRGFNGGCSLVTESRVKNLASSGVMELDRCNTDSYN